MVQAHAFAAGVETTRVTTDLDAAVRVQAGVFSYAEAAASLMRLGYEADDSTGLHVAPAKMAREAAVCRRS